MRSRICVCGFNVVAALYKYLVWLAALNKAALMLRRCVWAFRYKVRWGTFDVEIVELVSHEGFKGVLNWVDPDKPFEPWMHFPRRNEVSYFVSNFQKAKNTSTHLCRRLELARQLR